MKIQPLLNIFERKKNFQLIKNVFKNKYIAALMTNNTDTFEKFQPLKYTKALSIDEAKNFAYKNFNISKINCQNIGDINQINSCLCRVYNINKGKILFPQFINTYKNKGNRFAGAYDNGIISINTSYDILHTLFHEIGHYNHEKVSVNYLKMGKQKEIIASGGTDFSILEKFMGDKLSLKLIKKEISGYACSSPAEFVACTFDAMMCGRKISPELFRLYKEYEGPNAEILKRQCIKDKIR